MKFTALGPYYQKQLLAIQTLESDKTLWMHEARDVAHRAQQDITDTDECLQLLHEAQRLNKVAVAGLANNADFRQEVLKEKPATWRDFTAPPAADDLQDGLAQKLYNVKDPAQDIVAVMLGGYARRVGQWLFEKCRADNVTAFWQFEDPVFNPLVLTHAADEGIQALADDFLDMTRTVTKRIGAGSGTPDAVRQPDERKERLYQKAVQSYGARISSGEVFYTITLIPTPRDAAIDGIDYEEYTRLFFEMCDQPWDLISTAQQALIAEFNAAEHVRITNNDGTDIRMNIGGFTFCNSLIAKNVPGSEIFSAPHRESVEGIIVAKGRFSEHGKPAIENLTLEFEKGRLVRYKADDNEEFFRQIIGIDEGALYVGELGIGTNPHLKRHLANTLLVEKIGGSFHLALGKSYTMTSYEGVPVTVDNGNRSALHWDITTMLYGKEGRIYLDGRLIMDEGRFIDPRYDVLNRGWAVVPVKDRPPYWQDYVSPVSSDNS